MGTITFSPEAPKDAGTVHFQFGNAEFDLGSDKSFETDDGALLASAAVHPWLQVKIEVAPPDPAAAPDPNDPHNNPAADHLSDQASPEVKEAAQAAQAEIDAANAADTTAVEAETAPEAPAAETAPEPAAAPASDTSSSSSSSMTTSVN